MLSVPADFDHATTGQRRLRGAAHYTGRQKRRRDYALAGQSRRQGADNRFDLWKFRHLNIDENVVAFHPHRITLDHDFRIEVARAVSAVKLPGVPRADDHISVQRALRERPAPVRAVVIEHVDLAANIA